MRERAVLRLPSTPTIRELKTKEIRKYIWQYKDLDQLSEFFSLTPAGVRIAIKQVTGKSFGLHLLELLDEKDELIEFFRKNYDTSNSRHIPGLLRIAIGEFKQYMNTHHPEWHQWLITSDSEEASTSSQSTVEVSPSIDKDKETSNDSDGMKVFQIPRDEDLKEEDLEFNFEDEINALYDPTHPHMLFSSSNPVNFKTSFNDEELDEMLNVPDMKL